MTARRKPLLAGLIGQVIDVGAGTGASFGHYPPAVDRVIAVEPDLFPEARTPASFHITGQATGRHGG